MAFDPTKPAAHAPIVSQELRDQFNALKALNDAQAAQIAALTARVQALESGKPSMDDVNAAIAANSSANSNSVETTPTYASDPPTQSEVQSAIYKLNELIGALERQT